MIPKERRDLDLGKEKIEEAIAGVVEAIDRYRELYGTVDDQSLSLVGKRIWPPTCEAADDIAFWHLHESSTRGNGMRS